MESLEKRVAKLEFHQSLLMEMVDEAKKTVLFSHHPR